MVHVGAQFIASVTRREIHPLPSAPISSRTIEASSLKQLSTEAILYNVVFVAELNASHSLIVTSATLFEFHIGPTE